VGLLGENKDYSRMEEQIKILATNLEVLNQMLVKDPNLASGSVEGGGGLSPQQYMEMLDKLKALSAKIDNNDNQLREVLNQELDYIKSTLKRMGEIDAEFPKQKQELDIVVKRLNNVIEVFSAADKQSMGSLAKEMHDFNQNVAAINENIQFFQKKVIENVNYKVNEIGDIVANRLFRTGMIGIAVFVVVGILFFLLFAKG
jgi:methyl-accepting chemotaxis protein